MDQMRLNTTTKSRQPHATGATVIGGFTGATIGVAAVVFIGSKIPESSGPNAAAGAMLAQTILFALAMTVLLNIVFGIVGAAARPVAFSFGIASLPAVLAVIALWSDDPLVRCLCPAAGLSITVATLVGLSIRSLIEWS